MRVKNSLFSSKGIYLLVISLPDARDIKVGALGLIQFRRGWYVYVGSALGGFKSRLNRHMRRDKIPKWHIDYLLQKAVLKSIIICETDKKVECSIAQAFRIRYECVPRFGSSDCKCPSHLFYAADENGIREAIDAIMASLSLNGRVTR